MIIITVNCPNGPPSFYEKTDVPRSASIISSEHRGDSPGRGDPEFNAAQSKRLGGVAF